MAHLLFSILIRSTAVYQFKENIEKNVVFLKLANCVQFCELSRLMLTFHWMLDSITLLPIGCWFINNCDRHSQI